MIRLVVLTLGVLAAGAVLGEVYGPYVIDGQKHYSNRPLPESGPMREWLLEKWRKDDKERGKGRRKAYPVPESDPYFYERPQPPARVGT